MLASTKQILSLFFTFALQAHCHYVVLKSFYSAVQSSDLEGSNRAMVETLCALFGLFGILKFAGEFMMVSQSIISSHCQLTNYIPHRMDT